ncbi:MAG: anion permease, partial [Lachnospiraceae bacterium]|nr:anion permease [Lachnospiraceae bacterium]
MRKLLDWCKREIVLSIAILLAVISAVIIHPDKEYINYIDFRTLAILFCLMAVMAGLQKIGLFRYVAEKLLGRVSHIRGLTFILIMLCFFSSMLITNDVALITFVPFTFIVLKMIMGDHSEKLIVPVVVMQTIAANLGSMLTPIGNPQNLYLYGKTTMNFVSFMLLMLPYTVIAFLLLAVWCLSFRCRGEKRIELRIEQICGITQYKKQLVTYVSLFVLCIFTVAHVIPYPATLGIVLLVVFILDRHVLKEVDYALLLTFVGFFVFIGNMGRVPAFNTFIQNIIDGNEVLTGVVASQFMSNVPAALLLSGFTNQYELLIVGTNLGGLGTLIASMASLISFKYIGKEYGHLKGRYMLYFTVANILFLILLFVFYQ